jgi:hypothetical protein
MWDAETMGLMQDMMDTETGKAKRETGIDQQMGVLI